MSEVIVDRRVDEATRVRLRAFAKRLPGGLTGRFWTHMNASRLVSLFEFAQLVELTGLRDAQKSVVVSGDTSEPELLFLPGEASFLTYPEIDLDVSWDGQQVAKITRDGYFDVAVCNQVLEHVFSPEVALRNVQEILKPEGLLYLSVPVVNCIHGEPHYFSAGYHPRYISRLAEGTGFTVIHQGWWGSRKYVADAVDGRWLSMRELSRRECFLRPRRREWVSQHTPSTVTGFSDTWALLAKAS